jgi:hypothetical protein
MVVPQLVVSETSGFDSSSIFFTDGSKSEAGAGFGVYHSGGPKSSFRPRWSVYFRDVGDFFSFYLDKGSLS